MLHRQCREVGVAGEIAGRTGWLVLASIEALPVTMAVARAHAGAWASLERKGALIGAHDLWIGATALAHGMSVATSNPGEFERIPGLTVAPV